MMQRDRAAANPDFSQYDRLRSEMAWHVSDRINDVSREFPLGLDLGCATGNLGKDVDSDAVKVMVQSDISGGMLQAFDEGARDRGFRIQADDEVLPWKDNTFDIVTSNLALHWVNDLPGAFAQIKNVLVPDGLFIATIFGGETLYELRCSLQLAEIERKGGFAPRISPFAQLKDCGALLQRAGFTLLTVDVDEITMNFPTPYHVMEDLRGMGESNAAMRRQQLLSTETLAAAAATYTSLYGNEDGTVPATFQVIHLVGWKPGGGQVGPAARGSANASLKELGVDLASLQASLEEDTQKGSGSSSNPEPTN